METMDLVFSRGFVIDTDDGVYRVISVDLFDDKNNRKITWPQKSLSEMNSVKGLNRKKVKEKISKWANIPSEKICFYE